MVDVICPADLVAYRRSLGRTQAEVAKRMASTQSAVARLEKRLTGGSDVTLSTLRRYAAALDLNLALQWRPEPMQTEVVCSAEKKMSSN